MKQDQSDNQNKPPEKSFTVAFEQMAQLLRSEVKMKDRETKVLSSSSLPPSFTNAFQQFAKLLRSKASKPIKKRVWKKRSN
jgi:hypothetical protein